MATRPKSKKSAEKRTSRSPGKAKTKIEAIGEDAIIDKIAGGMSNRQIGIEIGVSTETVTKWLNAEITRSARAKQARVESAAAEDDKALEAIEQLSASSKPGDIAKARELAQHHRWRARVRNPQAYGDRVAVDHGVQGDTQTLVDEVKNLLGLDAKAGD